MNSIIVFVRGNSLHLILKSLKAMKKPIAIFIILLLLPSQLMPCTVAVVSGKGTPDGRPLLWKHRDTDSFNNKIAWLTGGKYTAMALIDSEDQNPENIWIGFNSAGFAIMNSASYNLKGNDTTSLSDLEGEFMKKALLACGSVGEFERFLMDQPKPLGVEANFGVIDAFGEAAFFETNNFSYIRIDANDPAVAPHGYIVRTNYSFTGEMNRGAGYIRFETAEKMFYRASGMNRLSVPHILENICLSLENSYSGEKVQDYLHLREMESKFMYFQDCNNRFTTSSSVIVQGVKKGESAGLTTMWAIVGFPLATLPVPVWLTPNGSLPRMVSADPGKNAPICDFALELKKVMVPSRRGSTKYYIQTTSVMNADGTGITQKLLPPHREIVEKSYRLLDQWRKTGINQPELTRHYNWIDSFVSQTYKDLFNL
jgi:hypothetical protein